MNGYTVNEQGLMNNFAVEPKMYVQEQSRTGFTEYAEKLNGRLAMLGFVSMLVMEALTGQGLISWLSNL
ncbi:high light inducible protein [Oxynema sp. CENA135]|jgi:hypothetical protein|uniref:chlorophyll a/b-binding protein n=1 Tax=Oxynema sp. CENA135 TaxID=984206 RepID=UPI00190A0CF5|nr:chlorophyll a/b-binding protein [Oxynema sp. CENA135]MBK4731469.1 high light inducible protein [Oxynema sp. CENA135]